MKLTLGSLFACAAISATVVAAPPDVFGGGSAPVALSSGEEQGSTIPFEEIELGFNTPGLIGKVHVKDGDVVKAGQVLADQDTAVEQAALAREKFLLKSNVQEKAAVAQRDLAAVQMKRQEKMRKDGSGSITEYEQAKVELIIAELKIALAKEETESKRLDVVKLEKQIERMQMKSPYDGEIRKVECSTGEVSDPQKPSIILVRNSPLKVETKLPTQLANRLKVGQTLQVRYRDEQQWREAKIVYFDPVADASLVGGAQPVHLEMQNPEGRRAGQEMVVKLPQDVASAK